MNILQIFGNTVLQFVFFGINLILLPALVIRLTENYSSGINRNGKLITVRALLLLPISLIEAIILAPISLIFGNFREEREAANALKQVTYAKYLDVDAATITDLSEYAYAKIDTTPPLYNIWRQIGFYIKMIVSMYFPSIATLFMMRFLLPETYAGLASNINSWIAFKSSTLNLEFFTNMATTFKNIIWNGLVVSACNENIILFIVIVLVAIFIFGITDMNRLYIDVPEWSNGTFPDGKGNIVDENGDIIINEKGVICKTRRVFFKIWKCLPTLLIILLVSNFTLAIFIPAYNTIADNINSIGMVVLLGAIVQMIITLIFTCPKLVLNFIKR